MTLHLQNHRQLKRNSKLLTLCHALFHISKYNPSCFSHSSHQYISTPAATPPNPSSTEEGVQITEDENAWTAFVTELETKDMEWRESKLARPNCKNMGLHLRALQNANVISQHNIRCFAHDPANDIHAEFRRSLEQKSFAVDRPEEEQKAFKDAANALLVNTLQRSASVVTTLHKSGDNDLTAAKSFKLILIDEGCQSSELETLLAWASNYKQALLILIIGDPKQLPPTVKSRNFKDEMNNPFWAQLMVSYYQRLALRGYPTFLLTEQYRLAEGLSEVCNLLFYAGRITDAEVTKLANRPRARNALEWIDKNFQVNDGIPHVCLRVPQGVCLKDKYFSRYNIHNVVVTIHSIRSMIADKLWVDSEITIITAYRAQASLYRDVLRMLKLCKKSA